jgi:DNA-binding transcriptional LysR family regulator
MFNLHHIQYFLDAAREGSITSASRKNRVSASAVSQAIRQLELAFGTSLIEHGRNQFQLTEEGEILAEDCHEIIIQAQELKNRIKERKGGILGDIEFGTQQSFAQSVLPDFLAHFQKKFPTVVSKFRLATSNIVQRWIEDREVNFGITLDNVDYPGCTSVPLVSGEFLFVSHQEVNINLLKKLGILMTGDTAETRKLEKSFRTKYKSEIPVRMRIDSWGVIKDLSSKGLGVGLIPDYLIGAKEKIKMANMKSLGLPHLAYNVSVVTRKNTPLNKASREFIAELQRWYLSR